MMNMSTKEWIVVNRWIVVVSLLASIALGSVPQQALRDPGARSGLLRGYGAMDIGGIGGDVAALGSDDDGRPDTGIIGSVVVHRRGHDGIWRYAQTVTAPVPTPFQKFGSAVSVDGRWLAVVASEDILPNQLGRGAVFVYEDVAGHFEFRQRLVAPPGGPQTQGNGSVVLVDGDRIVLGARFYHAPGYAGFARGGVVIFQYGPGGWVLDAALTDPSLSYAANLGVSVSSHGDYVVSGADHADVQGISGVGSAIVFRRLGAGNWIVDQRLDCPIVSSSGLYGVSVAMDGDRIFVGARAISVSIYNHGAVFVYKRFAPGDWRLEEALSTVHEYSRFGAMVEARAGGVVVLEPGYPPMSPGVHSGAVLLYDLCDGIWNLNDVLQVPRGLPGGGFIQEIAVHGDDILINQPFWSYYGMHSVGASVVMPLPLRPLNHSCTNQGRPFCVPTGPGFCPCGNEPSPGSTEGCVNGTGSGATLTFLGNTTEFTGTARFTASSLPPDSWAVLKYGAAGFPPIPAFEGAGTRCMISPFVMGGALPRMGVSRADAAGIAIWQPVQWGFALVGDRVPFQAFYRDPTGPCGQSVNWTSGVALLMFE